MIVSPPVGSIGDAALSRCSLPERELVSIDNHLPGYLNGGIQSQGEKQMSFIFIIISSL